MTGNILNWLESSIIGVWVAQSLWGYPIVLSSHAVGMAIVVGTVVVLNLGVLGYPREIPIASFGNLKFVAWSGVALNVLSGIAQFCGDPSRFFFHPVFWIKMALIALGAVSVWFVFRALPEAKQLAGTEPPGSAKIVAALSLVFWPAAIVAGRLIAYIEFY